MGRILSSPCWSILHSVYRSLSAPLEKISNGVSLCGVQFRLALHAHVSLGLFQYDHFYPLLEVFRRQPAKVSAGTHSLASFVSVIPCDGIISNLHRTVRTYRTSSPLIVQIARCWVQLWRHRHLRRPSHIQLARPDPGRPLDNWRDRMGRKDAESAVLSPVVLQHLHTPSVVVVRLPEERRTPIAICTSSRPTCNVS